jgi:hypothetical protein
MKKTSIVAISMVAGLTTTAHAQSSGEIQDFHERQMDRYRQDGMMALPKMKLDEVKFALDTKFKYPIKPGQAIILPPQGAPFKDFTIVSKIRIFAGSSILVKGHAAHPYIHIRQSYVASGTELVERDAPCTEAERAHAARSATGNSAIDQHLAELHSFPHRAFRTSPAGENYYETKNGKYQVVYLVTEVRSYEVFDGITWPKPDFGQKYSEAYLDATFARTSNPRWETVAEWYPTGNAISQIQRLLSGASNASSILARYPSISKYKETSGRLLVENDRILGKCGIHAVSIQAFAKSRGIPYFLVGEAFNPIGRVWSEPDMNSHLSCWLWENGAWRSNRFPWTENSMTGKGTYLLSNGIQAISFWRKDSNQIQELPLVLESKATQ